MEKICCAANSGDGDVAQLVEHRTGTLPALVRFPGAARDFFLRVNFPCRLSYGVRTPPCAIACIYVCAHVKDPVDHVRVRWIMETLKHPAYTLGWVARLCRSWLSRGRQPQFPMVGIPLGQYSCKKKERKKSNITQIHSFLKVGFGQCWNKSIFEKSQIWFFFF